ncbi:hypothetical protein KIW84_055752 [Lathyrus oleraceus]|uniref:Reverse transcriptase n=1 Tax=Pisum sativum TaxID=3888 RepID=A0A9D4WYN9_PEA|nr:hypothetical protein KIW84_055752 [Pisum sativum]
MASPSIGNLSIHDDGEEEGFCFDLEEAVSDCDLVDIPMEVHQFTWIRSRGTEHVVEERQQKRRNRVFRFENYWLTEEDIETVVQNGLIWKVTLGAMIWSRRRDFSKFRRNIMNFLSRKIFIGNKGKMHWLQDGDLNTKFFHLSATIRKKFQKIDMLMRGDGTEPRISTEDNNRLTVPLVKEELHAALLEMHPNKSLGPDGFNPTFYQNFWDVCVSKALANKLKILLDKCVAEEQSAFVEDRSIIDNVMIVIEVVHAFKRRTKDEDLGQEINITKYEVFFSRNISNSAKEDLASIMGVRHVMGTGKYLGLPSRIEGGSNNSGIQWMSWEKLTCSKKEGGLGFRDFKSFNMDMVAKEGWNLLVNPHYLVYRIFKARYYPRTPFLDANLGFNTSFVWRSIWKAMEVLSLGCGWIIGDESYIMAMNEPWIQRSGDGYIRGS